MSYSPSADPLDQPDIRDRRYAVLVETAEGGFIYWQDDTFEDAEAIAECLWNWRKVNVSVIDLWQDFGAQEADV